MKNDQDFGSLRDRNVTEIDRPIFLKQLNRHLAGWIRALLVILVAAIAATWNHSGVGVAGDQGNDDRRGSLQSPRTSDAPANTKDILDDAQREGPGNPTTADSVGAIDNPNFKR
jgi:hypothetical protein